MSRRFAVVHEAPADFQTATELADRVLVAAIDWLDEDLLPGQREWVAEAGGHRLTWTAIKRLAEESNVKAHGHFGDEPGMADARAARRAILVLRRIVPGLEGVVLVRDRDGQPDRRRGLDLAREHDRSGLPIVIGLAVVERESWVVCGFEPAADHERERHKAEVTAVGFDPVARSHELTAWKADNAPRSPKRVLAALTAGSRERERQCWSDAPLDRLQERGEGNGLKQFLGEVRTILGPVIGHVPPA